MRLFFAIPLNHEMLDFCLDAQEKLGTAKGIRKLKPQNLHLTLLFLGQVKPGSLPQILNLAEKTLSPAPSFTLIPKRLAYMPSIKKARMAWLEFQSNETFYELHRALKENLASLFQNKAEKEPLPHITLARMNPGTVNDGSFLELNVSGEMKVAQVELWESKTLSQGAEYHSIHTFSLRN